jgi:hypothetical protein
MAIFLVFYNASVMLGHLQQRKYGSITLSRTHVCGYRFSWSSFAGRLVMYEPVAIPRDAVDKKRSAQRTALDRWGRCWSIWSEDGQRLQFSQWLLGKNQTSELLQAVGIMEDGV